MPSVSPTNLSALNVGGIPVLPSGSAIASGNVIFLSSVTGSSSYDGLSLATPKATLAAASTACTANNGDIIYVLSGHAETISTSTAITLSKAGITIIGLGIGANRPTFTLDTATTATINVTAANIVFQNCIFVANFAAIVSCFTLTTAKDLQFINCHFRDTTAVLNFLTIVTTAATSNAADGLVFSNCRITSKTATAATNWISALGTNDRWVLDNNVYTAVTTDAGAVLPIATGKVLTNLLFTNNLVNVVNATGTATGYLITTDGTTCSGFIHNNFDHALPTTPLLITATSGFVYGLNYHSDQADKQGYLVPAADV